MKKLGKLFWGLFFILGAIFVVMSELGYYETNIPLMSVLLSIFILAILIKSIQRVNFFGILFSLAFICIIYKGQIGIEALSSWSILVTALLGSIGLSIIFNTKKHHHEHFDKIINDKDSEDIDFEVSFGSSIKYINSDNFKKANINCSFGAMKLYFENAKILDEEAIINLDASFSGVELYIPKEWKVINKVDSSLGSVEEKHKGNSVTDKTVIIQGKVNLAGVEIIYI